MTTRTERVGFLGVDFDPLTMEETLEILSDVTPDTPFGYVVTPNVDHLVFLSKETDDYLAGAYRNADLCVCDSRIVRHLARSHGLNLPLVTGSDLTVSLFRSVIRPGDRIAVVGGNAGLLQGLQQRYPHIQFLHHEPPMGLRRNAAARQVAAEFIGSVKARFTFLAVGSPQQELIAFQTKDDPDATGFALCVGASLEFITGAQRRAPVIVRRLSLEWLYRLLSDPKRMWKRYLVDGPRIFGMALKFRRGDVSS